MLDITTKPSPTSYMEKAPTVKRVPYINYIFTYKPTIFGSILTSQVVGAGLYKGHATQPESTVSMTAVCQRCSQCEPHSVDH